MGLSAYWVVMLILGLLFVYLAYSHIKQIVQAKDKKSRLIEILGIIPVILVGMLLFNAIWKGGLILTSASSGVALLESGIIAGCITGAVAILVRLYQIWREEKK